MTERRSLLKMVQPGHTRRSPLKTHAWIEIKRTEYHIIYECLYCDRRRQRKIKGQRREFKLRKVRRLMERSLA